MHSQLQKERKDLTDLQESFDDNGLKVSMKDSIGELSMYDNQPADVGSELFEREKDLALRDNVHTNLVEVEKALKRIEDGTYGKCVSCGKDIPHERLEALPDAKTCIGCQQKEEAQTRDHTHVVHSGSQDILQQQLSLLMQDNDASAVRGDVNDYPNIYDDWDQDAGAVEDIENIDVFKGKDGMFYAENPSVIKEIIETDR